MLVWKRLAGELIPVRRLFEMRAVGTDPRTFYAQSASLVGFLLERGGGARFLEFAEQLAGRRRCQTGRAQHGLRPARGGPRDESGPSPGSVSGHGGAGGGSESARDDAAQGLDEAVRAHYGFDSLSELESAWLSSLDD
jgi:hypothetical protein